MSPVVLILVWGLYVSKHMLFYEIEDIISLDTSRSILGRAIFTDLSGYIYKYNFILFM